MLLRLIFCGIAFEFHFRANTAGGRRAWDLAFPDRLHRCRPMPGHDAQFLVAGHLRGEPPIVISLGTPVLKDAIGSTGSSTRLFTAPLPILVVLVAGHSGARSGGITT